MKLLLLAAELPGSLPTAGLLDDANPNLAAGLLDDPNPAGLADANPICPSAELAAAGPTPGQLAVSAELLLAEAAGSIAGQLAVSAELAMVAEAAGCLAAQLEVSAAGRLQSHAELKWSSQPYCFCNCSIAYMAKGQHYIERSLEPIGCEKYTYEAERCPAIYTVCLTCSELRHILSTYYWSMLHEGGLSAGKGRPLLCLP